MFNNVRKFITLWAGAFMGNRLPQVLNMSKHESTEAIQRRERSGKGKGRRTQKPSNGAAHQRAAKKRKGVAINKARHAG